MTLGTFFLIVFSAGYTAFGIAGANSILQTKAVIHKTLGRKIKWNNYNVVQSILWFVPNLCFNLLFAWPLVGFVSTTVKSFQTAYVAEAAKVVRDLNVLSPEDEKKLNELIVCFEKQYKP